MNTHKPIESKTILLIAFYSIVWLWMGGTRAYNFFFIKKVDKKTRARLQFLSLRSFILPVHCGALPLWRNPQLAGVLFFVGLQRKEPKETAPVVSAFQVPADKAKEIWSTNFYSGNVLEWTSGKPLAMSG